MRKNKFMKIEKEIDDIAEKMFKSGQSITSIAKELKIDRGCLSTRLKKRGVKIEQHNNKKSVSSNFFNKIDSEEKAYLLGLLMADGSISDKNIIELCLKDADHIEKFKKSLKIETKTMIKQINGREYYRVSFMDKKISKDLFSLGCIPRKTFQMDVPNLDKHLMRHYIRGFFDGDGSISFKDKLNKTQISFSSGCESFLMQLCDYLNSNINFSPELYVRRSNTCYDIRIFNNVNKAMLLDYLYKDSTIYLDRKYKLYTHICRLESKLQKAQDD